MPLSDGVIGKIYSINEISLPVTIQRRLEALGMTQNATVSILNRKGKGILIIKLRGTRFALGVNITKNITVGEVSVS